MEKITWIKCIKHFNKILVHKFWVCYYCHKFGLVWRGLIHDLSKFSPIEFFESAYYYQGNSSPINIAKKENGYSKAWQHHKGRNTHHYEYWIDEINGEFKYLKMPYEDAVELIADYLGAARAYWGKDFSYAKEYEWWKEKKKVTKMNYQTKAFVGSILYLLKEREHLNTKSILIDKHFLAIQYSNLTFKDYESNRNI